jgi:hypothetical protein
VAVLRHWLDALRLASFLAFIVLGIAVLRADPRVRRGRINAFLIYMFAVSLLIGVSQRDAWPFSPYPLMRGLWNAHYRYEKIVIVGTDGRGREWDIDPMAWSPIFPLVLQEWVKGTFVFLTPAEQLEAAKFLYAKAEDARLRQSRGRRVGNELLLGPLTASDWWLYKRVTAVSPQPYAALRIYRDRWEPAAKLADPSQFERTLVCEYAPRR